jgi:stage II sporulation protein AA (anti-sigma F factor antagonist)
MIGYSVKEDTLYIFIKGDIDHHSCAELREEIDNIIIRYNPKKTVLDFRYVSFCDSSGIALVLGRYKRMMLMEGKLEVSSLTPQVKSIFDLAGLYKYVSVTKRVSIQ